MSAIIKSLRASQTDEALIYVATYIHEGGDINYLLRRLIIFASEDVGNATPFALSMANSTYEAFNRIGMPEGKIIIGQLVTYLGKCKKTRSSYEAIKEAFESSSEEEQMELIIQNTSAIIRPIVEKNGKAILSGIKSVNDLS